MTRFVSPGLIMLLSVIVSQVPTARGDTYTGSYVVVASAGYGIGATGSYTAIISGKGYQWSITVFGNNDGGPSKNAVDYVSFGVFDSDGHFAVLTPTSNTQGYSTSDGALYTNTSPWDLQPSISLGGSGMEWASFTADKAVAPYGGNAFYGTVEATLPASDIVAVGILLEGGQGMDFAGWAGYEPFPTPEPNSLVLALIGAVWFSLAGRRICYGSKRDLAGGNWCQII